MCARSVRFEPFTGSGQGQETFQQERDCKFTCKLLCCKSSFCHRVATKERRKFQLLSQLHRNMCRSLEFCKSCHKCPDCCSRSTCRGKATSVLGEVGSSGLESKSGNSTQRGLHPPLPVQTKLNQVTNCNKQLCQSTKTVPPFGGTVSAGEQKCCRTGSKSKLTGFLQPSIFGTQTQQPVETYPGPEHLEHLPKHRVVQNGETRDNKNLPAHRGVGHLHRLQGHILPYTNSQSVQEVHVFSHPGSVLPVQSPTLWSVHSTDGVHSGGQGGQTDGLTEGYKNPSVPRRLVGESHIPPKLSPAYTDLGSSLSRTRLAGEQGKVRTGPKTGLQLRRLPVRPQGGQGQTHIRALADLNRQDIVNPVRSGVPGPEVHVPYRPANSHRKTSPPGATSYEPHTVALEKQLEGTRVTGKGDTRSQVAPPSLKMVAGGKQVLLDASKEGWGAHLNERTARGTWSVPESKLHINHLELNAVFLALKEFQDLCSNNIVLVATDNTTVVAYINKEGGMKSGCPTVENPVMVHQETGNPQGTSHPRPAERDSRQAIQTWPDHSNRMVPSPRGVQRYMLPVEPAISGPVCHQVQQQTTTVCVTGSGPPGMGSGCTQPIMGKSGPIWPVPGLTPAD